MDASKLRYALAVTNSVGCCRIIASVGICMFNSLGFHYGILWFHWNGDRLLLSWKI